MSGESVKKIDPSYQFATLAIKGKIDPTSYHIYQLNSAENSQNDIKQTFIFQLKTIFNIVLDKRFFYCWFF